jgi:stress response protein YsnF
MTGELRLARRSREDITVVSVREVKQAMAVVVVCVRRKAVVWIEEHREGGVQSTVTSSRARARDAQTVRVDSRRASDECQDIHMIDRSLLFIHYISSLTMR